MRREKKERCDKTVYFNLRQEKEDKNDSRLLEEHQREEALEKPREPGLLEAKEIPNMEIENFKEKLYWGRCYKRKRRCQILEPTLSHGNSPSQSWSTNVLASLHVYLGTPLFRYWYMNVFQG